MKTVLTLVCVLVVAQQAAAQCNSLKVFDTTFVPACDPNDLFIKWPNYLNQSTYYRCIAVNDPVVQPCPAGLYFIYVLQECGPCNSYIPPVPCAKLKTQNAPNCVGGGGGGGGGGLPTPNYPGTTTTQTTTTKTTTTRTTTAKVPTPPSQNTPPVQASTLIPPPPSPITANPNVPNPPTPEPTPPSVSVEPPTVGQPGGR